MDFPPVTKGLRGPATILSYRAMLVAIVSQNSFVLVSVGIAQFTVIVRYVAKQERGVAQMRLCKSKIPRGGVVSLFWGGVNLPGKVSRNMGHLGK